MKSILILAFSDLRHDARINRQIDFLKETYEVSVASFGKTSQEVKHFPIDTIKPSLTDKITGGLALLVRSYDLAYRIIYKQSNHKEILKDQEFDLIIANDIETLPLAFQLSGKSKVLFDAHEYAPRHFEDKLVWRIFFSGFNKFLCKKYLPRVDAMLTVGDGLAQEYAKHYPVKPIVITNANYAHNLSPKKTNPQHIRLVHHGAANPSRQLEIMIKALDYVDERYTLDLILLIPPIANRKTKAYLQQLKNLIDKNPRVNILPPVKSNEVINLIHHYDVGVFLLPPINFNYKNTLPNKLFDFIQARLAIAIGPTPEMANLVTQFDLGVVSQEFTAESFGKVLGQLTPEKIDYFKNKSNLAAGILSADNNKVILNKVVSNLISN